MILITCGNPNTNTLANVVWLAQKHYDKNWQKVVFIDIDGSAARDGMSIEAERNQIVRDFCGARVVIQQQQLSLDNLASHLPQVVANEIKSGVEVVVDLTNGSKLVSSFLYATASLLRVRNLFFLTVPRGAQSKKPQELSVGEYRIDILSPLEDVRHLGHVGYFELIYLREEAQRVLGEVQEKHEPIVGERWEDVGRQMDTLIDLYFRGEYFNCVGECTLIAEHLADLFETVVRRVFPGARVPRTGNSFNDRINRLRGNFCDALRATPGANDVQIAPELLFLSTLDKHLDVMRVLRNESHHPRGRKFSQREARSCIDTLLLLLENWGAASKLESVRSVP